MIDCEFLDEGRGKVGGVLFGDFYHSSPFRIDLAQGNAEYYQPKAGGGLYPGGGTWTKFSFLQRVEASDTEIVIEGSVLDMTSRMVINRISGAARVVTTFPTLGKRDVFSGECFPGEDPETLPLPKARF